MKTFLKLFAIAAAFGMAPAAALAARRARRRAATNAAAAAPAGAAPRVPAPPRDRADARHRPARPTRIGLQPQVSPIGEEAAWFHDIILMPLITAISLFVLALLLVGDRPLPPRRQSDAVAQHPQHHARDRLDAGAGADPGGDRGALDPAARPPI